MILGIDLGQKTTGIAISEGAISSPYKTISHKSQQEALLKIVELIDELDVSLVVLGFVEGKIKPFFEAFSKNLENLRPAVKIVLWDETLTSRQATDSMVKLGIAKRKRAEKQHEMAASLILQSYLDSHE